MTPVDTKRDMICEAVRKGRAGGFDDDRILRDLLRIPGVTPGDVEAALTTGAGGGYERYQSDPCAYARIVLKAALTPDQEEILRSIVENRRTAVKASHAVGKTFVAAVAACWWYDCWTEHIVYITAPTWSQALGLTFKQIKLLRRHLNLPGRILESGSIRDEDLAHDGAHFIKAINAESGEGFQGEHTSPILQIYEEAIGVPTYIWESGDGLMTTPECRLLAIGNPTDEATSMGRLCGSPNANTLSINGLNHPNVLAELRGETPPYPKAIRLLWVQEMLEKECTETDRLEGDAFEFPAGSGRYYLPNAVFQGRVLGDFPSQADEQVIPRGWIKDLPRQDATESPEIGCDVARFGSDRSVIAGRSGSCLLCVKEIRQLDVDVVAGACMNMADDLGREFGCDPKKIPIRVDVTGGLGVAPAVMLRMAGYNVIEVNSSESAIDKEHYPNRRSELWFAIRERARSRDFDLTRIEPGLRDRLIRELSSPKWKPDARGHKVVEAKDVMKKRLGESPDLADGVNLAYYVHLKVRKGHFR